MHNKSILGIFPQNDIAAKGPTWSNHGNIGVELFHMTSAKSGSGRTQARRLHTMFFTVGSLNGRSVVQINAWTQLRVN